MEGCLKDKVIYIIGTGARKVSQIPRAIREFTSDGARVYTMLSEMGKRVSGSSLSDFEIKDNTIVAGYSYKEEDLPLEDIVLVAPCTFNTLNKMASGIADSYPLTIVATAIGAKRKVMIAPAMQNNLWYHPITSESLKRLEQWGCKIIWPVIVFDNVTMAPIEKVSDSVYHELIGVRFDACQLPADKDFDRLVSEYYTEFRRTGEELLENGLTKGSAGCMSMRINKGILVTSSRSQVGSLSKDEISLIKKVENKKIIWQGRKQPSSETPILTELYNRFMGIKALIHSHCLRITYDDKMQRYCTQDYVRYGVFGEVEKASAIMEQNDGFVILRYHGEVMSGMNLRDSLSKLRRRLEEAHGR